MVIIRIFVWIAVALVFLVLDYFLWAFGIHWSFALLVPELLLFYLIYGRKRQHKENNYNERTYSREPIPPEVRTFVWQRDKGHCVRCGSQEKLEYDHIIPVSKGGSNTARNIQLLCERCNRSKSAKIGE